MMFKRSSLASAVLLIVSACGVFGSEDETPTAGPVDSVPDAGEAAVNEPPPPPPIVEGKVSDDELNEKFGVFVTTTGTPLGGGEADGSRDRPYNTIAIGMAKGKEKSKRVYVCQGTFKESINLLNQILMVGGFECTDGVWKKGAAGAMTRVESPTIPALRAEALPGPTRIQSFEIVAPDGTDAVPTSIGLVAKTSPSLTIANSKITAGRGKDGAPGVEGIQLTQPNAKGQDGLAERLLTIELPDTFRPGAAGGVGTCIGAAGFDGENGGQGGRSATMDSTNILTWVVHTSGSGAATVLYNSGPGESRLGTDGENGSNGQSANPGTLTPDGFVPGDGTPGTNGKPGKGGKGGNGGSSMVSSPTANFQHAYTGSGPGGGAGGCPGLAGTPGKGGGASIGALLVSSPVTFDASTVTAGDGGNGGKGTFGSSFLSGGIYGSLAYQSTATTAAVGGKGGDSGVSGSGAGGSSFGIAQTGADAILQGGAGALHGKAGDGVPQVTKPLQTKTLAASAGGAAKDIQSF